MTQYTGTDNFPSDFTIPDDTAPPTASQLLVSIEALGDRTMWLKNRTGTLRVVAEGETVIADGANAQAIVTLGGNPATFNATAFVANPANLPLFNPTVAIGDVIEFEISGMIRGSGIGDGSAIPEDYARIIVNDGSIFEIGGAKRYGDIATQIATLKPVVDDGSGGYVERTTWATNAFAGTYFLATVPGLKAGEIVDIDTSCVVSLTTAITPSTHTGQIQLATQEPPAALAAEPGAHFLVSDISTQTPYSQVRFHVQHVMAADGSLGVSLQGKVDAASDSATLHLRTPICAFFAIRRQIAPVVIVGRYVATHVGPMQFGLDGKVSDATRPFSWVGAFICRWRVWRSNA